MGFRGLAPNPWKVSNHFLGSATGLAPWGVFLIGGGAGVAYAGDIKHPGIASYKCGLGVNSGVCLTTLPTGIYLSGGELFELVFCVVTLADTYAYIGFHDSITANIPTTGVYLNIVNNIVTGKARDDGGPVTTTVTQYNLPGTLIYYRVFIYISSDGKEVTFYLVDFDTNALLWGETLDTNIPTTPISGSLGCAVDMCNAAGNNVNLFRLDYIGFTPCYEAQPKG